MQLPMHLDQDCLRGHQLFGRYRHITLCLFGYTLGEPCSQHEGWGSGLRHVCHFESQLSRTLKVRRLLMVLQNILALRCCCMQQESLLGHGVVVTYDTCWFWSLMSRIGASAPYTHSAMIC